MHETHATRTLVLRPKPARIALDCAWRAAPARRRRFRRAALARALPAAAVRVARRPCHPARAADRAAHGPPRPRRPGARRRCRSGACGGGGWEGGGGSRATDGLPSARVPDATPVHRRGGRVWRPSICSGPRAVSTGRWVLSRRSATTPAVAPCHVGTRPRPPGGRCIRSWPRLPDRSDAALPCHVQPRCPRRLPKNQALTA
jgi:hypothetical protein